MTKVVEYHSRRLNYLMVAIMTRNIALMLLIISIYYFANLFYMHFRLDDAWDWFELAKGLGFGLFAAYLLIADGKNRKAD